MRFVRKFMNKLLLTLMISVFVCLIVSDHFYRSQPKNPIYNKFPILSKTQDTKKVNQLLERIMILEKNLAKEKAKNQYLNLRLSQTGDGYIIKKNDFQKKNITLSQDNLHTETLGHTLIQNEIPRDIAEDIIKHIGENKMALLELRDQAFREGWIDSEKYLKKSLELSNPSAGLRNEFGDTIYDQYLYAVGETNRILIKDVYPDSQAEYAILKPGDVFIKYAGKIILTMNDLRIATASGVKGETVLVELQRNGAAVAVTVSRGPLGVEVEPIIQEPANLFNTLQDENP